MSKDPHSHSPANVAVRGKHKRDVERGGVIERLLHSVADAVGVVLGLDQRQRNVRLVIEDVVGAFRLAARNQLAAHDDPALGEADLLADLQRRFSISAIHGGGRGVGAAGKPKCAF